MTAAGIIPADWEEAFLGSVIQFQRGFDLPNRLRKAGTIPIISSAGEYDTHNQAMVSAPGVVTGRYGTIGGVFYVREDFWPLNTTLFVKDFKGNHPLFVFHLLKTIDFASHSGKSGVPGVNRNDLHELIVALPPLAEQRAIAETLGAVDALLTGQRALLAKKRDLKQATQQALLTRARRLPGFTGEWEERAIKHVTSIVSGGTPSTHVSAYWGGDVKWMSSGELHKKYVSKVDGRITEEGLHNSSTQLVPPGCVLIGLAGQGKTRGTAALNLVELCTNQSIAAILPSPNHDSRFLFYNVDSRYDELRELSTGDGGRGGLNLTILGNLIVWSPPLAEQRAIAAVLSDMDTELEALAAQLAKTEALKQGLMQDLLTGTIRLNGAGRPPTV